MVKKSFEKAYASKRIKGEKRALLFCAALSAVVDTLIIIMLAVGGMGARFSAVPVLMLILDIVYFTVSLFFTNFRFKYSLSVWISYAVVYLGVLLIGHLLILGGEGTVITTGALVMWTCAHIGCIICAVVCALTSSRVIKCKWIALACAAALFCGGAAYSAFLVRDGFLGQGTGSRALVYVRNGEGYEVSDVLAGKGRKVDIPLTFNGRRVTHVDCAVFVKSGVNEYFVHDDLQLTGVSALNRNYNLNDKKINVDKKAVNGMRERLYFVSSNSETVLSNAAALANATLPAALDEGEGYVSFTYDETALKASRGNIIPVFVGDLSAFDFETYAKDFDYVAHRADGSGDNFDWAYKNGGYILTDIAGGNGSVIDEKVSGSTVAKVQFDRVFRITNDGGNDEKYNVCAKQPEICFDTVGGQQQTFKYATASTANKLTEGLTPRKGFSLKWYQYTNSINADGKTFTDLSEVLKGYEEGGVIPDNLYIRPQWTLDEPTVSITATAPMNTITYGENVTISADAHTEAEGVTLSYRWTHISEDGTHIYTSTKDLQLTRPKPLSHGGVYELMVLTDGGDATSLSCSIVHASIDLNIRRKSVRLIWDVPKELVYDGTEKTVTLSVNESEIVEGDADSFGYSVKDAPVSDDKHYTAVNAKTYNLSAVIDCDTSCYEVLNKTCSFTVQKRPAAVTWEHTDDLVYNAKSQAPTAKAEGIEGALKIIVTGSGITAGVSRQATAATTDNNYALVNDKCNYVISKAPLTVKPRDKQIVFGSVVNGTEADIEFDGFVGSETYNNLTGKAKFSQQSLQAGTYPTGLMVSGYESSNYDIAYLPASLEITPLEVTLRWSGDGNSTYNGYNRNVTASVSNTRSFYYDNVSYAFNDVQVVVEGGGGLNAGDYTATAVSLTGADAENYVLPASETARQRAYTIGICEVKIYWATTNYFTYDGTEKTYGYTVFNMPEKDKGLITVNNAAATAAGTYTAEAVLAEGAENNFVLTDTTHEWRITQAIKTIAAQMDGATVVISASHFTRDNIKGIVGSVFSWQYDAEHTVMLSIDGGEAVEVSGGSYTFGSVGTYRFEMTGGGGNYTEVSFVAVVTIIR